nr:DUF4157 domain-containing protein [uncultured Fibrobacter sp.]
MQQNYSKKIDPIQKASKNTASSVLDASSQSEALQRKADMTNNAAQREEAPRPNNTGMPDNLKSGIESLSGFSMDDVRVHYNSSKPATVQALAYTQGTDIHVAPGQEKHLPHEAWHVAQQMAGRVSPTTNINGMPVNDNVALEHEADVMGEKALQYKRKGKNICHKEKLLNMGSIQKMPLKSQLEEFNIIAGAFMKCPYSDDFFLTNYATIGKEVGIPLSQSLYMKHKKLAVISAISTEAAKLGNNLKCLNCLSSTETFFVDFHTKYETKNKTPVSLTLRFKYTGEKTNSGGNGYVIGIYKKDGDENFSYGLQHQTDLDRMTDLNDQYPYTGIFGETHKVNETNNLILNDTKKSSIQIQVNNKLNEAIYNATCNLAKNAIATTQRTVTNQPNAQDAVKQTLDNQNKALVAFQNAVAQADTLNRKHAKAVSKLALNATIAFVSSVKELFLLNVPDKKQHSEIEKNFNLIINGAKENKLFNIAHALNYFEQKEFNKKVFEAAMMSSRFADSYTKLAGEGARFICVRNHMDVISDNTLFYIKKESIFIGVTFETLWKSWSLLKVPNGNFSIENEVIKNNINDGKIENTKQVFEEKPNPTTDYELRTGICLDNDVEKEIYVKTPEETTKTKGQRRKREETLNPTKRKKKKRRRRK